MKRVSWLLLLCLWSCGGPSQGAKSAPQSTGESTSIDAASAEPTPWWLSKTPCPDGGSLSGAAPPRGQALICRDAAGRRAGPAVWFYAGGAVLREGRFEDDRFQGTVVGYFDVVGGVGPSQLRGSKRDSVEMDAGVPHGTWTEWYATGNRKRVLQYRKGLRDGPFTMYFPDGAVSEEGRFAAGKPEGELVSFFASGAPKSRANFHDGVLNGDYQAWHETGKLAHRGTFEGGKQIGLAIEWYPNGTKKQESSFVDGKPDGPFRAWFESGALQVEGANRAGARTGTWTIYRPNGTRESRTVYSADGSGKREQFDAWHRNGKLSASTRFAGGAPDGLVREWYADGKKSREVRMRRGKRQGLAKVWFESGRVSQVLHYRKDALHGRVLSYWPTGKTKMSARFVNGKPTGKVVHRDEDGVVTKVEYFGAGAKAGELLRTTLPNETSR